MSLFLSIVVVDRIQICLDICHHEKIFQKRRVSLVVFEDCTANCGSFPN